MKQKINAFDYAGQITKVLGKGVLLTTKYGDRVNTMTIGWGMLGIEWGKPVFIALVRESRYTKELLEKNGEFTINVPYGEFDSKIISFCGTKSGRTVDKVKELGLELEEPEAISVPGIRQFPLTLECKVIYTQKQVSDAIPEALLEKYYPCRLDHENARDCHTAYYGEIVNAYIIQD